MVENCPGRNGLLTFEQFKARNYFPSLDGLRALAILLVVFHHVPGSGGILYEAFHSNARFGVSVFFVVSGFLITTLFFREKERMGSVHLPNFYFRRAFRLLPLYYIVLAVECVLIFAFNQYSSHNQELFRQKFSSYLFYFSNLVPHSTEGPFFFAWSLAAEEQFYFVFGLLFLLLPAPKLIFLTIGLLVAKFALFIPLRDLAEQSFLWRVMFSYQEPILIGVLVAYLLNSKKGYEYFRTLILTHRTFVFLTATFGLVFLIRCPIKNATSLEALFFYVMTGAIVGALMMQPKHFFLEMAPLQNLGKVSYGIYLLHMFVINSAQKLNLPPQLTLAISLVAVWIIANITFRWLELPLIKFAKNRFPATAPRKLERAMVPGLGWK